uniref:FAR1 domain-containing protein n=1 Tax=Strongyloides stercoralis TaxID=6248 RepID=A0A0K0ERT4_STRER
MSAHYNMFNQMYSGSCEKYPEFIDMVRKAMENSQSSPCTSNFSNNVTHNSDTENSMSPVNTGAGVPPAEINNKIENHIFRPQAIIPGSTIQGYPLTDLSTNQNGNELTFRNNIYHPNIVSNDNNIKINNMKEESLYKEKDHEDIVKEENNENESNVNNKKHDHTDDAHSETGSHASCTTIDESSKSNSVSPVLKSHSDNDNESAYSSSPLPKEEFHDSLLPPISDAPTGVIVHGAKFISYADFESVFENWKNTNFHPFRVASSETLRQSDGSKNETFQYRYIVFHCAHYGKPRMRGVGKRPNQSYLPCGCKAMLRLNFSYNDHALRITSLNDKHNGHPVNQENYSKVSIKGRRSTGDSLSNNKNRKRRSTSVIKKESSPPTPQINISNSNNTPSTPISNNLWKNMINGSQSSNTNDGILSNPFVPIPNPSPILNGTLGNRNNFNGDFQNTLQNLAMFNLVNSQNQQNPNTAAAAAQLFYANPFQQQQQQQHQQQQQQMMMNNVLLNLFNQQRNQLQMASLSKLDKENAPLFSQMPSFLPGTPHQIATSLQNQQTLLHPQQSISNNIVIPQNNTPIETTPKSLEAIKEEALLGIPTPGQPPAKKDINDHNTIKNILFSINDALTTSSKESLGNKITQLTALLKIWNDSTGEMLPMKRLIENSIKQSADNNI